MSNFKDLVEYAVGQAKNDVVKYGLLSSLTGTPSFHYVTIDLFYEANYGTVMRRFEKEAEFKGKIYYSGMPQTFPAKMTIMMFYSSPIVTDVTTSTIELSATAKKKRKSNN